MSKRHGMCVLGAALLTGSLAVAAEPSKTEVTAEKPEKLPPIVVMASKTGAVEGSLGQSVDIITGDEIRARGHQKLTDVLRELPGVDFTQNGPIGFDTSSVRIRGMKSYHTKFLIDGVPMHDPSSTQMQPLLGGIRLDSVDRIEVVKGSSSLQGTSAMGGVINIVTKRPTEEGDHGTLFQEFGSHGRYTTAIELLGKHGMVDYRFNVSRMRERGISAIYRDYNEDVNLDDDHLRLMTYDGRIGFQLDESWRLEVFGMFQERDEEFDSGYIDTWAQKVVPDPDDMYVRRTMFGTLLQGKNLFNGMMDTRLQVALTRSDRIVDKLDGHQNYRYTGDHRELSWDNTIHLNERNDLTLGVQFEEDQIRQYGQAGRRILNRTHRTGSYYLGYQTEPIDNLFINLNGRMVDHSEYGIEFVGDASIRYTLEQTGTVLKGSIGRGYRTPSLWELYANDPSMMTYGNPDLDPETSYTWEIGFEQPLLDEAMTIGSVYFENRYDDFIDWTSNPQTYVATYEQYSGVTIRGFESFVNWKLLDNKLLLKLSHTYQRAENEETGEDFLAYVPRQKVGFDAIFTCLDQDALTLNLGGVFVGSRWNSDKRYARAKVDDYILMHAAATYKLTKDLSLTARIDNLLNTRYFDNYTTGPFYSFYNTYGRTYYVGVKYSF